MQQRVLVCGGRDYSDKDKFMRVMDDTHAANPITLLITGGAPGADSFVAVWARTNGVPYTVFPADWQRHGLSAGPIRNQKMLDEAKPHFVIAFRGGKGTADMVNKARRAGVPVAKIP